MVDYNEQLKHPKWQRRRLEIMQRAGFKCENCGEDEITLHVHHLSYNISKLPWEYNDNELRCLCNNCHKEYHGFNDYAIVKNHVDAEEILKHLEENPAEYLDPERTKHDCLRRIKQKTWAEKMRDISTAIKMADFVMDKKELRSLLEEQRGLLNAQGAC